MKNLTRRSDAGQGGPFHKALKLVERACVLAGKVQVVDWFRLVVSDRGEVSWVVGRVTTLHERVRGPMLKVYAQIARGARSRSQRSRVDSVEVTEEKHRLRLNMFGIEACATGAARIVRQYRAQISGLCGVRLPRRLVIRKVRVRLAATPLRKPRTAVEADHHLGVGSISELVDRE